MAEEETSTTAKEGENLLGPPSFTELENGRFKCVETGHEVLSKDKESYSQSKRCRLGLVNHALSTRKAPLNMFKQDPLNRSKLVCKLTGDTVNKTEEHIWKHINGRRFLNKLELKEMGKLVPNGKSAEGEEKKEHGDGDGNGDDKENKKKRKKKKKKKDKKAKTVEEIVTEIRDVPADGESDDSEVEEAEFWMPPKGARWDFEDGDDRWGSDEEAELDEDGEGMEAAHVFAILVSDDAVEDVSKESDDLSCRTKRMAIEIGPSSNAPRKKKSKKNSKA
ncbi:unnamed protein product [Linum tenue]|uniref:Surfeit locus protein 2 n=1 Tax=Linum tenue TaxID=586396 RepID=A0AAV0NEJ0_9ROSI|nr:unnamed protein product [Linum tenue]